MNIWSREVRFLVRAWIGGWRDDRRISVAITTFNRTDLVSQAVAGALRDPRVAEILIHDDGSSEPNYDWLREHVAPTSPLIRLHRNEKNTGAFDSKLAAVRACTNDWVVLLDSDNQISRRYIDRLFALPAWSPRVIYCPERAYPHHDYRRLSGCTLDIDAVRRCLRHEESVLMNPFLGTGNFLIHRATYVAMLTPYSGRAVAGADVNYSTYLWLRGGGLLQVVPGLEYAHLRHKGSLFMATAEFSKRQIRAINAALIDGTEFCPPPHEPHCV